MTQKRSKQEILEGMSKRAEKRSSPATNFMAEILLFFIIIAIATVLVIASIVKIHS